MSSRARPSVLLIREREEQLTGSGCCGRLEGEFLRCSDGPIFPERRAALERLGPIYRTLRDRFGDAVEIQVIDPRNLFSLVFLLVRDFWNFQVGLGTALRTLTRLPVQAVVVNGHLVARGEWPDPDHMVAMLDGLVSEASRQPA